MINFVLWGRLRQPVFGLHAVEDCLNKGIRFNGLNGQHIAPDLELPLKKFGCLGEVASCKLAISPAKKRHPKFTWSLQAVERSYCAKTWHDYAGNGAPNSIVNMYRIKNFLKRRSY
ncbi:hypothetical protein TNCV_292351 [Trichonephila clavipes]|nr:hypothetical protein TNCV_292351 [Trichonephila clavipes]